MKKKIVFLTGTRADFGKIKSLLHTVEDAPNYELFVFVTGMHLLELYGLTLIEIKRCGFKNIYTYKNETSEKSMDLTLANTIKGFSKYVDNIQPDLIVVHGDRVEAMAGASVGALNNILVAHIEGGEVSGTIDELIRHSTSKLSHLHFVSNEIARKRLLQMGEIPDSVYVIGSPDVDIMFSTELPDLHTAKKHYDIPFKNYSVAMFHPVTTEIEAMDSHTQNFVNALIKSEKNYIVVYPNNDMGSSIIIENFKKLFGLSRFKVFPSIRFEYFLTLLKNSEFIIGNSSAGIREAPYYGIPTINIGTRQSNRSSNKNIINTTYEDSSIVEAIKTIPEKVGIDSTSFGVGNSSEMFLKCLDSEALWKINQQKRFNDIVLEK